MGMIYTPNILKYSFIDSLYDTPTFQKLWHVIDFIYFRNFYTSMAKKTPAMIPMMGKEAVVIKFTFLHMELCHKLYYPKKQLSVGKSFVLLKCQLHLKQYIKTKRVCFEIKLYKLTSSNGITEIFSVNSRERMFHNGGWEQGYVTTRRNPFSPTIYFLLLITPDIPRVSGSNYAIKRLSSVKYFF